MIESRCGILCSSCGYKEEMGCVKAVYILISHFGVTDVR